MKFRTVIELAVSHSLDVRPPSCATMTVESLAFAPLIYALKKQSSSEKASKIYYMGDLHLQLTSADLQLEFGTGSSNFAFNFKFVSLKTAKLLQHY